MGEIVNVPCVICAQETRHDILHTAQEICGDGDDSPGDIFDTLQCRGCQRVSLRHTVLFNNSKGEVESLIYYYPSPRYRNMPEWMRWALINIKEERVPEEIFWLILYEVYDAVQNGLPHLAIMGIRAILEQVIVSKIGDHGSFSANLEAFKESGYISLLQFDALTTVLEAGHAVIHRGSVVTEEDLNTALDIMEGVLAPIYHHRDAAERLSEWIPPRPPRRKPSKPKSSL